ncbi:MAG: hypothetical protein H0Z38_02700 [Firmicutes bacterium]|nr:hypothetical protein [Bacillota bacterium]
MAKRVLQFSAVLFAGALMVLAAFWFSGDILTAKLDLSKERDPSFLEPVDAASVPAAFEPVSAPVAVVRLSEVLPLHPAWPKLQELEQRLSRLQAGAGGNEKPEDEPLEETLALEGERLTQEYQAQLEAEEKAAWKLTEQKIERKKAELKEELQSKLESLRQELTQELAQKGQEIQGEYQARILSLRVKMELLDGKEDPALAERISELQKEIKYKLEGLEREYQAKVGRLEEQLAAEYQERLKGYSEDLIAETQAKLEQKRAELEAELKEHLEYLVREPVTLPVVGPEDTGGLAQLAQEIAQLRTEMLGDIRSLGERVAYRLGLETVVLTEDAVFGGKDITEEVKEEISKKEGSPIGAAERAGNTQ